MQKIIARLSQIDSQSGKIMDAAATKVKQINEQAAKRKDDYYADAMKRTDAQLSSLRDELTAVKEKELAAQEADSQEMLAKLEQNYNMNHAVICSRIFNKIIEN